MRYFDAHRGRPGLPEDVAAFVDRINGHGAGVQLVNLSTEHERVVILQAGTFGEHTFKTASVRGHGPQQEVAINGKYFAIALPPSTAVEIDAGMDRFMNQPSYAFPWHADGIPVPFQEA